MHKYLFEMKTYVIAWQKYYFETDKRTIEYEAMEA